MTCYNPIDARVGLDPTKNGKRQMVFGKTEGSMPVQLPCGKCDGCRSNQAMMWSVRCYHESTLHEKNCFLTLTYSDENLPSALVKADLQKFFKRLRHHYDVRYFACGEYGGSTRRPHYHALIFGQDWRDGSFQINSDLYSNPHVESIWGKGMISIGSVSMSSCCYVAGYVNKKIGDPDTFSVMSRMPGIGKGWLDKYKDDLIRTGFVTIEGKEIPIPMRYIRWFESEFEEVKLQRKQRALLNPVKPEKLFDRRTGLYNKERNKKAQLSMKKETI